MRTLIFGLALLLGGPALGADEPYGWAFCTDPEAGLGLNRCIAHVRGNCDVVSDRARCLSQHHADWFAYDTNASMADAVRRDAPKGALSLDSLSEALGRASPSRTSCSNTDMDCLVRETIKRALGNHALRVHRSTE